MPQPTQQQQQQQRRRVVVGAAAVAGAAAAGGTVATAPVDAARAGAVTATVATAGIMGAFIQFLSALAEQHRLALSRQLGRYTTQPGDIAGVVRQEMTLEREFARRAADRLAGSLPQALRIEDPVERERKLRGLLEREERFAAQRGEAMFARAIAALTRSDLRGSSPLGAFWRLGAAQKHTEGCLFMSGHERGLIGRFWPWAVLDRIHPPRHYGCLVDGTRVWGPAVQSAMSRWYEGQIVRIAFRSGREIGITPNHPVLKRGGWVAADALRVGDQVVCCTAEELRMRVGDPNEVQMPSTIEQVARALADAVPVQASRVPVAAEDFHGDGREGYVDVVRAGGLLDDRLMAADAQQLGQVTFRSRDRATALLASDSAAGESVVAVRFASFGSVRGAGLGEALLVREPAFAQLGGVAAATERDIRLAEATQDGGRRDAGRPADGYGAFAGEVATDEIVGIEWVIGWRGHVHNLETREGWYSAGGIVVHNCTSSLHGYGEAVLAGWMTPSDVPDTRAAVRAAAGVVMEQAEADAVLAELDVRDRLLELGVDTSMIPFAGVAEAFDEGKHPRDWKGRFRTVGDVAATMAARSIAWRIRERGSMPADARSSEQIVKNWTRQLRGSLSHDRAAIASVAAANAENAKNELYQRIVAAHEPDHVVVIKPRPERTQSLMWSGHGTPHRVAGTTAIPDEAVRTIEQGPMKSPADHPASSAGYGLAAVLRHEYGHSIDDLLPRDVRRHVLDAIPNPSEDLTYYTSLGDQEVIPELLALITHPDYRAADWPQTVQEAERRLLAALGVKRPESPAGATAGALKRGARASIDPKDAPALVEALADGERSALHQLEVRGHPNLFRAHARELSRAEMPQIPKEHLPGFMDFLRSKRVGATVEEVAPSSLQATQNQVNGAAVAALAKGWDPQKGGMMMVSREGHVLDGHHRWGAAALHEMSNPSYRVNALRFSVGTDRMLALMREYNGVVGVRARKFGEGRVPGKAA